MHARGQAPFPTAQSQRLQHHGIGGTSRDGGMVHQGRDGRPISEVCMIHVCLNRETGHGNIGEFVELLLPEPFVYSNVFITGNSKR